jgi:hypothetical protein
LCITRKSKTLKLAPTLAQYLYDRKKLTLPGVAVFPTILLSEQKQIKNLRHKE